jgi:hypothetical protein
MTYNNCVKQVIEELDALPQVWAEKLACNICSLVETEDECATTSDCQDISECETVTSLSTFTVIDDKICISFKDERGVTVKRCFIASQFTDEINETDGLCIDSDWNTFSSKEKWQAVIDKICNCCNPTTTTTTTSTTTTTTIQECPDCYTIRFVNPDNEDHDIDYVNCDTLSPSNITLGAGESVTICGCSDSFEYDNEIIAEFISDTCNAESCESCNKYTLINNLDEPQQIHYIDCATQLPAFVWVLPNEETIIDCACTDSVVIPDRSPVEIIAVADCDEITTSTTTTTTLPPCRCYNVQNPGAVDRVLNYTDCDGDIQQEVVPAGTGVLRCAPNGFISGFGLTITDLAACADIDACNNDLLTTTTTTTSTTTTTTAAPTTTTTTTSTTTITTVPIEEDIVYFTNSPTVGDRGAIVWFSANDYYTPNTPASLIPANCLNISDLGPSPAIEIELNYWTDDDEATIDDGFGDVRTPDGTKTINVSTDLLTYNGSSGAWQRGNGLFTLLEGANIAAFEITSVTSGLTYNGVNHQFNLPPANHFIRVHNTFSAGATGVIWFDLT